MLPVTAAQAVLDLSLVPLVGLVPIEMPTTLEEQVVLVPEVLLICTEEPEQDTLTVPETTPGATVALHFLEAVQPSTEIQLLVNYIAVAMVRVLRAVEQTTA
jgi:hypothetical protein